MYVPGMHTITTVLYYVVQSSVPFRSSTYYNNTRTEKVVGIYPRPLPPCNNTGGHIVLYSTTSDSMVRLILRGQIVYTQPRSVLY